MGCVASHRVSGRRTGPVRRSETRLLPLWVSLETHPRVVPVLFALVVSGSTNLHRRQHGAEVAAERLGIVDAVAVVLGPGLPGAEQQVDAHFMADAGAAPVAHERGDR